MKKRDIAFGTLLVLFSALGFPLLYYCYLINSYGKANAVNYEWPTHTNDLLIVPVLGLVLYFIQKSFEKAVTPFLYRICKIKDNEDMRNERANRSANRLFKCTYYVLVVCFEVYYFSD
jgi:hypothetical protein